MNDLYFETLKPAHAEHLFETFSDESLYRFIPEKPPRSLASMAAEYEEFAGGAPEGSGEIWLNWVIRKRRSQECLGTLQATRFADSSLWIGYKVSPRCWGLGIATQGVLWMLGELAVQFPGQQILASVDTRNLGSMRVLEKCGFVFLRTEAAELHGAATQDVIYALQLS